MIDQDTIKEVFAIAEQRRADRRRFIKTAAAGIAATGALTALSACGDDYDEDTVSTPTPTPTPTSPASSVEMDVLNFALNLEYLEANYYISSAFGTGLNSLSMTGTGTQGTVIGGRQVTFTDPTVANYAREIAADENAHVLFLRSQLGSSAVAMPTINIDGGPSGAFTAAATAAKIPLVNGGFDPYLNDDTWLLGGMLLSDVGVTAYKGSATLIANKVFLEAAAGILAVEAYHSGLIRTLLYSRGIAPATPIATAANDRTYSNMISDARDSVDGTITQAGPPQLYADDDQGVTQSPADANTSNIVPSDSNGIVFGRTAANVLNVVYLNKAAVSSGGFFPSGVNGNIKTSNNNA